ncbi:MAG TPA: hypothetical protein VF807_00430 [Ktedonobacterales bacterium]
MSASRRPRTSGPLFRRLKLRSALPALPILGILLLLWGLLHFFPLGQPASQVGGAPGKPGGTAMGPAPSGEVWTQAQGLPKQTMSLTFSTKVPGVGFATAFVDKATRALYATTDGGTTWSHVTDTQAPVAEVLVVDPTNAQDLVMLSTQSPAPGAYTLQRSTDGGHTWQPQATTLPSSATVSQWGWADDTFLVSFQLDRVPTGDSALVAFPASGASLHLDVDGKINGVSIPFVQLLTSFHHRLQVWGTDDAQTPHVIGLATANLGKTWQTLSVTAGGKAIAPVATTADGASLVALTTDQTQAALSHDGGLTWQLQKSLGSGAFHADRQAFVTGAGQPLLHVASGTAPGMYGLRNGDWARVTARDVIAVSTDANGNLHRLWSYDTSGLVTWMSY